MTTIDLYSPFIVYDGAVTRDDIDEWNSDLDDLLGRDRKSVV